jgi:O-antigen/teichoic acid export membrane protein
MKFGLHETAAFATALTLNATVTPLFQFVGMVLLPYVSKNLVEGNVKDIKQKVKKLRLVYLGIGMLSVVIMYIFTEFIISLLFSKEYSQFAPIVRITYLSVIPYSLYLLLRNPIDAISKIPFNTLNLAIGSSLLMGGVILSPSTYAAAIAFPVSYLVLGILSEITWKQRLAETDREPNTIDSQFREKEK